MSVATPSAPELLAPQPQPSGEWQPRPSRSRSAGGHIPSWAVVLGLIALTLISAVLRTRALHVQFWVDEGISVGIASHPLSQLPSLLRQDGSPPLYYVLLHVWMALWGRSEVATHVLSLIFALITIPVAYWSGSSLFGRRVGAYCAVLAAGVPFLTAYAQETRMYSLLLLLSLLVAVSFVHAFVYRHRRHLALFVVSLAASLYTHNWALFLGLATFGAFLITAWLAPQRRPVWRDGALAFGLVALLYLPWLPTLLYQSQHTGAPWALPPVVWSLSQGLYGIVGGRGAAVALLLGAGAGLLALRAHSGGDGWLALRARGRADPPGWADGSEGADGSGGALTSGGAAAVRGAAGSGRDPADADRLTAVAAVSLLVIGLGAMIIAWLYAKATPAWAYRYLAIVVGPLLLAVGLGLARASRMGIVALALVCCFWVLDPSPTKVYSKSNVAAAAQMVRARTGADALVLSTQPEQVPVIAYYLSRVEHFATPLGPVADPRVMDWRNALSRFRHSSIDRVLVPLLRSLTPGERVVLVMPTQLTKTPEWMKLIRRDTILWGRYLDRDPSLRLIASTSPHQFSTGVPVRMRLYVNSGGG